MVLVAIGDEQITVSTTAVGLTAAEITTKVHRALVQVEAQQLRYNPNQDPTSGGSEGSPLANPGDSFYVNGQPDLNSIKFIREGSTDATINVLYEGEG